MSRFNSDRISGEAIRGLATMKPRIFNKVLPTVWPKAVMAGLALAPVAAASTRGAS